MFSRYVLPVQIKSHIQRSTTVYYHSVLNISIDVVSQNQFIDAFKMPYTHSEAFDMLTVLGEFLEHYTDAAVFIAKQYLELEHHCRMVVQRSVIRETGQVQSDKTQNNEIERPVKGSEVLTAVHMIPHDSTRRLSIDSVIGNTTIWRILKDHKVLPYRMSLHQEPQEDDYLHRTNICMWATEHLQQNPNVVP